MAPEELTRLERDMENIEQTVRSMIQINPAPMQLAVSPNNPDGVSRCDDF